MIEIQHLAKSFRRAVVLDGVSLEIPTGNRVALVGANGAGKTTLIRCLLGEYNYRGSITVGGLDPRIERTAMLRGVGFVPQIPPPLRMPVDQLLRFAARLCGSDPFGMEDVAARLGLDVAAVRRQPFAKLSGGQKQKLLIAVALGRRTQLLVMDEPAANLDPEARRTFLSLLALQPAETTMLISSHRLDEVSALVGRVIELDAGRVTLDDHVADGDELTAQLRCRLELRRPEPRLTETLQAWGLAPNDAGLVWQGMLPAGDRLRFVGMVSRYGGLFRSVQLEDEHQSDDPAREVAEA